MRFWNAGMEWMRYRLGGPDRARVIVTFACVLGLDGADKGAIGAMAGPLQHAFGIGRTELGLLLTASVAATAVATFLFGWLVDRANRIRLLVWAVAEWAAVMIVAGLASSYFFLLCSRVALGAVVAAAAPAIASLVGDYFPPGERGAVYGTILSGEIIGSGVGFLLAGELSTLSWRAGFIALAVPAGVLVWAIRKLREPARGGRDQLPAAGHGQAAAHASPTPDEGGGDIVQEQAREKATPRDDLILRDHDRERSLWWAIRYVLRIPTNRILIISSAAGYFYLTGVRTFGVEYLSGWFHVSRPVAIVLAIAAGSGALAGVLLSGRLADHRLGGGHLRARVSIPIVAFLAGAGLFLAALSTRTLWIGLPVLALAALALGAINPPLDAARLDIMPGSLWGRAESVRTCLRKCGEAIAPLLFGYLADQVFGGGIHGLHLTLLLMLAPFAAGGLLALLARRTYLRDVATARASASGERDG